MCDASEDEEAVRQTLARVREMAICGLYRNCAAVEQEIRNSPHYPLIRDWFKDPLFCDQIDELCSEARKKLQADREPTKAAAPLGSPRDMATKIRQLTPDEKQRIEKWALAKAQSERPSDHMTVVVYGFTDNEGRAPYSIIRTEREAVSPDDIPEERSET